MKTNIFPIINDIRTYLSELNGIIGLIEAMGSRDALELNGSQRQDALYHLADTTTAIKEKIEASLKELEIINRTLAGITSENNNSKETTCLVKSPIPEA